MNWEFIFSYVHLVDLGIAVGIFLLFLVFRKLFTKYIFAILMRFFKKTRITILSYILQAFEKPMQWIFIILGVFFAITYYPYFDIDNAAFLNAFKVIMIILVTWGLFQLASSSSQIFEKINEKTNIQIDEILIPLLSRTVQFIVLAISLSVILQQFGYQIDGLVAGLGLGGLAFSLAAKDALANMFGGVIIITEKPFTIGDWIMTPSVEGTVEDITFRSTRVRTFADALVTVPNSTLANESITNWSKMGKRQITFNIRITYDTPRHKIENVVHQIKELLHSHPGVHQETIFVNLDQYKENGLDVFLYFFTNTTVWGEFLNIREDINLKILDIIEREGVSIAIPSRRLFVDSNTDEHGGKMMNQES
ncbi:mechanosensitive ion channel [Ornithinibacillus sp. L9]|uniref:Mechanosensitive ion channel n=1 Tax=Ornithinibacillus caprae TaxID=2678566 RepID=A0A6N8FNI5_9BACI|nr:mechanosensitive ion channel family protein [Ornithinibacillus caprae]MUK89349.1 mechanosensitive ion channel [Ornithinibacillus caprae]